MNITFKHDQNDPLPESLTLYTRTKLESFAKFIREGTYETHAHVVVTRESGAATSDAMWRTSITLDIPGTRVHAQATGRTALKSTALALRDLKRELRRENGKDRSIARTRASMWKSFKKTFSA